MRIIDLCVYIGEEEHLVQATRVRVVFVDLGLQKAIYIAEHFTRVFPGK